MAGIKTSEFFGRFKDFKDKVSASVPLAQPTAYFDPQNLLKFFSKSSTSFPNIKSPFLKSLLSFFKTDLCIFLSC